MRKRGLVFCIHLLMVILFASSYARAAGWRSPLGYAYVSGFREVLDIYEDNLEAEGYYLDSVESWPLISFHPYVQYGSGFGDTCCTYWTGLGSDHRGYNMKNAELFRNGQSKPVVLKESKE